MNLWMRRTAAVALTVALCGGNLLAADVEKKTTPAFGVMSSTAPDAVKAQALDWLKSVGKTDEASLKSFEAIWSTDRPTLDKLAGTFALGNADAGKLLADARNPDAAAPQEPPAVVSDDKQSPFFRSNFALVYAKSLSDRHVYEQVLDTLKTVKAEQTVDPSTYFFTLAVSEHALIMKDQALDSIDHLLADVSDAPQRYRTVGALMAFDMANWKDGGQDIASRLDPLTRKMRAVKDRLDLERGGEKTQKMEKEIVFRLDEVIKELENQQKGNGSGSASNNGNCPPGGDRDAQNNQNITSTSPAKDDYLNQGKTEGKIDAKKLADNAAQWGNMKPKERADAMRDMTKDLPPDLRDQVERYFKELSQRLDENDDK
ncbi:MAG TPA: hypothetical protein VMS17_30775 [Gemmataceae bacterium]|nr:hypothetical protein [Gemmataceae bacterium]